MVLRHWPYRVSVAPRLFEKYGRRYLAQLPLIEVAGVPVPGADRLVEAQRVN